MDRSNPMKSFYFYLASLLLIFALFQGVKLLAICLPSDDLIYAQVLAVLVLLIALVLFSYRKLFEHFNK